MSAIAVDPYGKFYEALATVLKATATITAVIPQENIFPSLNPGEARPGGIIVYAFQVSSWDKKAKRGEGTLRVSVESVVSKQEAHAILHLARYSVTPRTLSRCGKGVTVAVFKEQPLTHDDVLSPSERFNVDATFAVKWILAPE